VNSFGFEIVSALYCGADTIIRRAGAYSPLCVPEGEHFDAASRQSVVQEVVQA
jgi:hypothetical protein